MKAGRIVIQTAVKHNLATPLTVAVLIVLMEYIFPLIPWYTPAFVLLYLAFGVNARLVNGGRGPLLISAAMICAYMIYSIPDQVSRWSIFSAATFLIAANHDYLKRRYIERGAEAERLRQRVTRQTERIREQNLAMAEIEKYGSEVARITRRITGARDLLQVTLDNPDKAGKTEDIRQAIGQLNESLTLVKGYQALASDIEKVRRGVLAHE